MKKNIGTSDRIIRFVIFDFFLGFSYMGADLPAWVGNAGFVVSIFLIISVITAYSPLYHFLGWSTVDVTTSNLENYD